MTSRTRTRTSALLRRALPAAPLLLLALAPDAPAQSVTMRRPVHLGDVTGLEMSLEGATHAPRGGRLRWLVTVHEVVGLSDLRPAPRVHVRLLSSLVRDRAVQDVVADDRGRAELALDVPEDAPQNFHVQFEAVSPRGVRRQFDLDVGADPGRVLQLLSDRTQVRVGGEAHVWGRLSTAATRRPAAGADVVVDVLDDRGRPALARQTVHTDASGAFALPVHLPAERVASYTVTARAGEAEFATSASLQIATTVPETPALVVRAAVSQPVVNPRDRVGVDVVVRTGDGRPVANAQVSSTRLPRSPEHPDRPVVLRTDARGRTHFEFVAPENAGAVADLPVDVTVARAGIGQASTQAVVRVARERLFGAVSVEGGAMIPSLPGRVFVRVVRADGAPAGAGVRVDLTGPSLPAGLTATTDADGVARIDARLAPPAPARVRVRGRTYTDENANLTAEGAGDGDEAPASDPCGGGTATGFSVAFSNGSDRGTLSGCLPVDPDATVRVRAPQSPSVEAGGTVAAEITRAPSVASLPVELALVARRGDAQVPLAAVLIPPGQNRAELTVPSDAAGLVLLRARPLQGGAGLAVRGGSAAVWATPGRVFHLEAHAPGTDPNALGAVSVAADHLAEPPEFTAVVLPREEGEALLQRVRASEGELPLGDLRVDPARAGANLLGGALASLTPEDDAAAAVLRGNDVIPMSAPEDPGSRGLLRDPWRARARFVEGRLALVFQQIEQHVSDSLLHGRDNVAVRGPGGEWTFNREIFDAIQQSGGDGPVSGGARSLGGAPLTIEQLRRLDPAFTYNNLARRITRRRMFAVLLALRRFVAEHNLDLRWSWRGDPATWLRSLVDDGVAYDDNGSTLDEAQMLDGWGTPFALRPARGGRARFGFLAPVPGFELVSAGPDGRLGTADDVVDPFARILPSGGAYARAVDEDGLLARLHGVELGRATIVGLAQTFDVEAGSVSESGGDAARAGAASWNDLPSRVEADPHALDLLRPGAWADAQFVAPAPMGAQGERAAATFPLRVDDEPRTYAVVVHAWGNAGYAAAAADRFGAGTPVLVDLPLTAGARGLRPVAPRVAEGETIRAAATVTNLSEHPRVFHLRARAEGPLAVEAPESVRVAPGEVGEVPVTVRGAGAGRGALVLSVQDEQGQVLREVRAPVVADRGALGLREDVGALVAGGAELSAAVPGSDRVGGARLVLLAPAAMADDPELDAVRREDPALVAWAYALATRELPPALASALYQAQSPAGSVEPVYGAFGPTGGGGGVQGFDQALSTACALVVWSAAPEDDTQAAAARARAVVALPTLQGSMPDAENGAGALRERAAVLAALATGAQGAAPEGEEYVDPVAAHAAQLVTELRSANGSFPQQPSLLARAAAALLLADPADERAVLMFDAARRAVVDEGAGAVLRPGPGRGGRDEEIAGSAALAVAAQQRGEVELAQRLARGLAARAHFAMRLGGESTFWLLAASSFGAFGAGSPEWAEVTANGRPAQRVAFHDGRALVPIEMGAQGGGVEAHVALGGRDSEGAVVYARLEVQHERAYAARDGGPLRLNLVGDPGYAGEVAALELEVSNSGREAARAPVVELQLPSGAAFDAAARAAMLGSGVVTTVEVRDGAMLRVVLHDLSAGQSARLALALRWLTAGNVTGLGAAAYTRDHSDRITVLPGRVLQLAPRPEAPPSP